MLSGSLTRASGESVAGSPYAIQQGTLAANGNYSLTYVGANFNITQRPITVTPDSGQGKVYGDADPTLTYSLTGGTLATGDTLGGVLSGSLTRASGESVAGSPYAIQQGTLAANGNYNLTFDANGETFAITARSIEVTPDSGQSKVYGDADPALTYSLTGGTLATGDTLGGVLSGSLTRASGESVAGSPYAIQQGTLAANGNYNLTYVANGETFAITARPITVTADAQSKVYGNADPTLTYQVTSGSLVSGDSFSGALTRASGESVAGSPYAIQQGTLAANGNYSLTYVGANFNITQRPITVTPDSGQGKVYGDADPTLTYSLTGGTLATGDTLGGVLSGSLTRASGESVAGSPYAIQQDTLAANSNYNLTFVGANLTITQRPITMTADNKTKVLGATDPALTYQVTSGTLATGDTLGGVLSGSLTRDPGESIGSYAITKGTLAANGNYAMTFNPGTLKILYGTGTCLGSPGHTILQPVNADGSSVFKQGSTVPAKFRVCDANGNSIGTAGVVTSFKLIKIVSGLDTDTVDEAVVSTTPDTAFRWSATDQQWIFNINTKSLATNKTYTYRITLADGTFIDFEFGLKK